MPALVARKALLLCALAVGALALAGIAWAGNGGIGPEPAHSPNAVGIRQAYWLVFGLTAGVFVIVEAALVIFVFKYRSRGRARTDEGPEVHGHTRLELIWTVVPVLILAAIATFVFVKLPSVDPTPPASAGTPMPVQVIGHQFYWEFRYPGGQYSINEMHVPAGKVVSLSITSPDVNHSWWIPQLGGKTDAIPGRVNKSWFKADAGTYTGQCAEFCGMFHAKMQARVVAEPAAQYRAWLAQTSKDLGRAEFTGACQTCHGIGGKGGYGPPLAGNPLVAQPSAIEQIVRNGRSGTIGTMPPVGRGWTKTEMDALTSYLKKNLANAGGTSGG
jgi:cytochrome c oxidase subunit II